MAIYDIYDLKRNFKEVAGGSEKALAVLYNLYGKKVYAVALKFLKSPVEAEEIIQEVFLALWKSKENLKHVENPEGYIFTIVHNTIYAHLKKISQNRILLDAVIQRFTEYRNTTEDIVVGNETNRLINEASMKLPAQQRMVYELSKLQNLSYDEIAEKMGLSKNTVRNHLAEAMKSIRSYIKKHVSLIPFICFFYFF
ncbi:MAG TPA: RNA polymerase sigma-70 factor [Niabella sp.]|nr:RNA polymerase sigma-70 factor [Niabella sp.]